MKLSSLLSLQQIREKIRVRRFVTAVRTLTELHRFPDVDMSLRRLRAQGFEAKHIFDVGAYEGQNLASFLAFWPEATVVAFEPLDDKATALRERFRHHAVTVVDALVGDKDIEHATFYSDKNAPNASSVCFSQPAGGQKQLLTKRMTRLDTYIDSAKTPVPNFVQIDTLSFEYQIVKGLGDYLPMVEAIMLQLNFLEVFHGVTLAHEVIDYLGWHGFVMYDVCDVHRRPLDQALWQMDCLFVRADSHLRQNKNWA